MSSKAATSLAVLNDAKFSKFHIKAILVAGIGFFTDAYDLFIINLVVPMIGYAYFNGSVPVLDETLMKGAAVFGTFLGQIFFGVLADKLGRKKIYGVELAMMIGGTVCAALSSSAVRGFSITAMIVLWRFIVGVGIGGDYPLSAVITSEYANVSRRGMMIAAVFAMQGVGILVAGITSLIVIACFKTALDNDPLNSDYVWRICLGLGVVPAVAAVYFRATLPETPRFTMHVEGDVERAVKDVETVTEKGTKQARLSAGETSPLFDAKVAPRYDETEPKTNDDDEPSAVPKASWADFKAHFGKWENGKVLLGCALSWFLLDVAFYGLSLNQSIVLTKIGYVSAKDASTYDTLFKLAAGNTIINCMGTVPGYWLTVLLVEKLGRKKIQYIGFGVLTAVFVVLSAAYHQIQEQAVALFIALYCIGLFFFNFGPNTTTFIIPGEVFPTRYRSTGHGLSAAAGKLGAILASYVVTPIAKGRENGLQEVLGVFSIVMFLGLISTYLVPETKGLTLEELSNEPAFEPSKKKPCDTSGPALFQASSPLPEGVDSKEQFPLPSMPSVIVSTDDIE
jgi:PHS family inorganic phosphate transporter-like MFS transporter